MRRSFYLPVHAGPVKCVAAAAPFVATGGADDTIHLFDVAAHADLGFLMSPGDGAVTAIAMYAPRGDDGAPGRPTHLLSGAADGGVTVWSADPANDKVVAASAASSYTLVPDAVTAIVSIPSIWISANAAPVTEDTSKLTDCVPVVDA